MRKLCSTILAMQFAGSAFGAWSSGGGHLISIKDNAWFVQNTKVVHYCIKIDEDHFGTTAEAADQQLQKAVAYWQREFRAAKATTEHAEKLPTQLKLATQSFVRAPCSSNVDIQILLGVLSGDQENYLRNPRKIVAETVVTAYDRQRLKSKGFIYISPESGRLSLDLKHLAENRWSIGDGRLLKHVFIHELGHVFGLDHTESPFTVMGRTFPMYTISWLGRDHLNAEQTPSYFLNELAATDSVDLSVRHSLHDSESSMEMVTEILESPFLVRYIKFEIRGHRIFLYGSTAWDGTYHLLASSNPNHKHTDVTGSYDASDFFLPPEQTVFNGEGEFTGLYERPTDVHFKPQMTLANNPSSGFFLPIHQDDWTISITFKTGPRELTLSTWLWQGKDDPEPTSRILPRDLVSDGKQLLNQM